MVWYSSKIQFQFEQKTTQQVGEKNPFPTNELIQSNQEDFKRKSNYYINIKKNWVISLRNGRKSFMYLLYMYYLHFTYIRGHIIYVLQPNCNVGD